MDTRVLVACATKYGATAGIAEGVGQTLCDAGLPTDNWADGIVDEVKRQPCGADF